MNLPPTISVILPVRNEAKRISECLNSIVNQDFPEDKIEILAIDGMSTDGSWEILCAQQKKYANFRLIINPRKSVTAALNIGIHEALGQFIVRCDAHAAYALDYLSSCIAVAEATGAGNVGGHVRALPGGSSSMAHAIMLAHESPFGLGGARFRTRQHEGFVETVWLGCYRKELFGKVGGYNELLPRSEDIELNARLRRAGYTCYLSKNIRAWYYCRPNLRSLFWQRLNDGIGIVRTLQVNRSAVKPRHLIPLLFLSSIGVLAMLSAFRLPRLILTGELSLYGIASMSFALQSFFTELRREEDKKNDGMKSAPKKPIAALMLPAVFGTLHSAYGLGSLIGLFTLPFFVCRVNKARFLSGSRNQEVIVPTTKPS